MKIVRAENLDKKFVVVTESNAVIREFYHRADAYSFLEHIIKFPAVGDGNNGY